MKRTLISMTLGILLASLVFGLSGCSMDQHGETAAEGHRRHVRNLRLNRQAMNEDLDALFHLDEPSTMTERTIP